MKNRNRKNQLNIRLSDKEMQLFNKKFELSKSKSMTEFLIKCVLEKEIFIVDMEVFYKLQYLLSNQSNNINQVARRVNIYDQATHDDIKALKVDKEKIARELFNIQKMLKIKTDKEV